MNNMIELAVEVFRSAIDESREKLRSDLLGLTICMCIFLNWPVGSGKTYTVNHDFEELADERGWKMSYLCNRRSLKKEFLETRSIVDTLKGRREPFCEVFLYQELEGDSKAAQAKRKIVAESQLIICDECHYFCKDALFNPRTKSVLDYLITLLPTSCIVFMSATMQVVQPLIAELIQDWYRSNVEEWQRNDASRQAKNLVGIDAILCDKKMKKKLLVKGIYDAEGYCELKASYEEADKANRERLESYDDEMTIPYLLLPIVSDYLVPYLPPDKMPPKPILKMYIGEKDVSGNYQVHVFSDDDNLVETLNSDEYPGKSIFFVTSKKRGKRLRDAFAKKLGADKVVYIDADYDACKDVRAQEEMQNIVTENAFSANVAVVTPVLDNGVNLHDQNIKNVVLLCEDEIDWKQMLGRRRITPEDNIHVFISGLSAGHFRKRSRAYLKMYWKLCGNPHMDYRQVFCRLKAGELTLDEVFHFYDDSDDGIVASELSVCELRRRFAFCYDTWLKMEQDPDYFLKLQCGWIGKDPNEVDIRKALIEFSDADKETILTMLKRYEVDSGGLLSQEEFDRFKEVLINTESKRDKQWKGKVGGMDDVNVILSQSEAWNCYSFMKLPIDKKQYFELRVYGKPLINISEGITEDDINKALLSCGSTMTEEAFKRITGSTAPKALNEGEIHKYVNTRLGDTEFFSKMIRNQSGAGKLVLGNKPKGRRS